MRGKFKLNFLTKVVIVDKYPSSLLNLRTDPATLYTAAANDFNGSEWEQIEFSENVKSKEKVNFLIEIKTLPSNSN